MGIIKLTMDEKRIPAHVAVIMDGNGRWAKQKGLRRIFGHRKGVDSIDAVITAAIDLKIKVVTFYAFSSENWSRPKYEIKLLMRLLEEFLDKEQPRFMEKNIKLTAIGRLGQLPERAYAKLQRTMEATSQNTGLILNLALSYGARNEIVDAVKSLCRLAAKGEIKPDDVDEAAVAGHLYTAGLPDPDLLIRTSGELRVSNFLLWQISYAELYVTPVLWPEFGRKEFLEAIKEYQHRNRRFGKINNG